jgi:hypothetical protein
MTSMGIKLNHQLREQRWHWLNIKEAVSQSVFFGSSGGILAQLENAVTQLEN